MAEEKQLTENRHPSLMSKKAMEAASRTSTNSRPLVHELLNLKR